MCSGPTRPFLSSDGRARPEVFAYRACTVCGLVYLASPPADPDGFDPARSRPMPDSLPELRGMAASDTDRLDLLLRFKTGGRLLEIGPGIGLFAVNAREAGFDVCAIERDPACVAFLNEVAVVETWPSDDPAAILADHPESADAIAFWQSLEQLATPWRAVREAARALRPGGILLVATPNIASRQAAKMGARWCHLGPHSRAFLPPHALASLCADYGLEPVQVTTADALSDSLATQAWASYARSSSVPRRLVPRVQAWLERRHAGWQATEGQGAGLTAIFRRPII